MERPISFSIEQKGSGLARAGVIRTPHGAIQTPAFLPVATKATVKGMQPAELESLGAQALIATTYHLYLSPGPELIAKAGGIHAFMGWQRPLMTDSGGFQVFSLGEGMGRKVTKFIPEARPEQDTSLNVWSEEAATAHGKLAIIDEDGVTFTSHLDGSLHRFTPERSIEIQHGLGADIIYAFDECTSPTAPYEYQKEAMDRTHVWARRSLAAHRQDVAKNAAQGIYGIVQGGRFDDLRRESAQVLGSMEFDGYGIGGSFSKDDILAILENVDHELPDGKPRHLLGIGEPEDMLYGVAAGIDTFDCVLPTRNGRNGTLYTAQGKISIQRAEYRDDFSSIDPTCDCFVCAKHTRGYLHHLFRSNEMLGPILATAHNIRFLVHHAENIRSAILDNRLDSFAGEFLSIYKK